MKFTPRPVTYGLGPEKDLGWRDSCTVHDLMGSEKPLGADDKTSRVHVRRATDAWLPQDKASTEDMCGI